MKFYLIVIGSNIFLLFGYQTAFVCGEYSKILLLIKCPASAYEKRAQMHFATRQIKTQGPKKLAFPTVGFGWH